VNRYLRSVLGRFSGGPPHALQPEPSRRWSSATVAPLGTNEATESEASAYPTATTPSGTVADRGPGQAERSRGASGKIDSATFPEESRDAMHPPKPPAHRAFDRSLIPNDQAPGRAARIPLYPDNRVGSDASQPARVESAPAAVRPGAESSPVLLPPRAESRGREQDARRQPGERSSVVTLQPVLTPPREPASRPAPYGPPSGGPAADREARRASIVLTPAPARAAEAPSQRAEIVIGRISVVIESARPSPPAPRPAPRPAGGSTRPADGDAEVAHRFGLGQL
jgi:hypothetical protein